MIRPLTISDLKKWTKEASSFHYSLDLPGTFNPKAFLSIWKALIYNKRGFVMGRFVDDQPKECIGIMLYPDPFTGTLTAASVFWFVAVPASGLEAGYLHKAIEAECRKRRAVTLFIGIPERGDTVKAHEFLQSMHYSRAETNYRKDL